MHPEAPAWWVQRSNEVKANACTKKSNSNLPPVQWALTIDQILEFLGYCQHTPQYGSLKEEEGYVSITNINKYFVVPWTRGSGCSVALHFNQLSPLVAVLMLSHAWDEDCEEFASALLKACHLHKLPTSTPVYFCAFSNYQGNPVVANDVAIELTGARANLNFTCGIQTNISDGRDGTYPDIPVCARDTAQCKGNGAKANVVIKGACIAKISLRGCTLETGYRCGDVLLIRNYMLPNNSGDSPTINEQVQMEPFRKVIESPICLHEGGMLVVHTSRVDPYDRMWCVHEIERAKTNKLKVRAIASAAYGASVVKGMLKESADTQNAACSVPEDEAMIRGMVIQNFGRNGFEELDKIINSFRYEVHEELQQELNNNLGCRLILLQDTCFRGIIWLLGLALLICFLCFSFYFFRDYIAPAWAIACKDYLVVGWKYLFKTFPPQLLLVMLAISFFCYCVVLPTCWACGLLPIEGEARITPYHVALDCWCPIVILLTSITLLFWPIVIGILILAVYYYLVAFVLAPALTTFTQNRLLASYERLQLCMDSETKDYQQELIARGCNEVEVKRTAGTYGYGACLV